MFRESSQPKVSFLQLGEALVPLEEHKGVVTCISRGTRTLSLGFTVVSWCLFLCFCIPSLSLESNVALWNSGRPRRLNEAYFLQTRNGDTKRICTRRAPQGLCFCSVTKSCLTICDPMSYITPGFPVLHYLPEFAQTHVHWVSNAIQPSHPLLPPSSVLSLSQDQGLFQWVSSWHQVAKVLQLQLQHQPFPSIFRVDFL